MAELTFLYGERCERRTHLALLTEQGFQRSYSTSAENMLDEFLIPALSSAVRYDRAAGYFSTALFALISTCLADFAERGGRMRLLCSPHLSESDAVAVEALGGGVASSTVEVAAQSIRELAHGTDLEALAVRCLSAMIGAGILDLKFVTPKYGAGLFHSKTGVIRDAGGNVLAFNGSANETAAAWSGVQNHETIDVFRSWVAEDRLRVLDHASDFDELWNGYRPGWTVTDARSAAGLIIAAHPPEPLEDVLAHVRHAYKSKADRTDPLHLRTYQRAVVESWEAAGSRGIVAFATGGGKTRVGLEIVRRWTAASKPALVLVPTRLLHDQWWAEIRSVLPEASLLRAGAGASRKTWLNLLASFTSSDAYGYGEPRITLATYDTASSNAFLERLQQGSHLLVVADEVHNFGAVETRKALKGLVSGAQLGLSATPDRYGDAIGTAAIYEYFGESLRPPFGIAEALESGVLVPYRYELEECRLSEEEGDLWDLLSHRIGIALARSEGEVTEEIRMLLIRRSRVLKRAEAKARLARDVIERHYSPGDRWLIYCSDIDHLGSVQRELAELDIPTFKYHSRNQAEHGAIMDYFGARGGLLLAVKCLDEGIDIPLINGALILASSTNPREYIQRRGRVLRRSPGKYSATLVDALVVDHNGVALTPSEVTRGIEFATHALNDAPLLYLENQRARLEYATPDARGIDFEDDEFASESERAPQGAPNV